MLSFCPDPCCGGVPSTRPGIDPPGRIKLFPSAVSHCYANDHKWPRRLGNFLYDEFFWWRSGIWRICLPLRSEQPMSRHRQWILLTTTGGKPQIWNAQKKFSQLHLWLQGGRESRERCYWYDRMHMDTIHMECPARDVKVTQLTQSHVYMNVWIVVSESDVVMNHEYTSLVGIWGQERALGYEASRVSWCGRVLGEPDGVQQISRGMFRVQTNTLGRFSTDLNLSFYSTFHNDDTNDTHLSKKGLREHVWFVPVCLPHRICSRQWNL